MRLKVFPLTPLRSAIGAETCRNTHQKKYRTKCCQNTVKNLLTKNDRFEMLVEKISYSIAVKTPPQVALENNRIQTLVKNVL